MELSAVVTTSASSATMKDAMEASASTQRRATVSLRSIMTLCSIGQHPIPADDRGLAGLRRLEAAVLDAAAERAKRLEGGNWLGAVLYRGDMHESAIGQAQHLIGEPGRRSRRQLAEYRFAQALILVGLFGLCPVPHHCPFQGLVSFDHVDDPETPGECERIRPIQYFRQPNPSAPPECLVAMAMSCSAG